MAKEKPEKLLDEVIDAKVSAILAERNGDIIDDLDSAQGDMEDKAARLCKLFKEQQPKNGESPSGGS
ncbi:MAG: hypothetical protein ACKPKO_28150, partial [Candidatus Fonsibacter sp.]